MVVCCVIIASMGIALTGCSDSSDKDAGNSSGMNVESSTDTNAESGTDTNVESNTETNDENRYLGTWAATVMESAEGDVYDYEEKLGVYEITLNADGSASMLEEGETIDCGWEPTENGVKMSDSSVVEFTYEDGKLVTEVSGVTIYFEKK